MAVSNDGQNDKEMLDIAVLLAQVGMDSFIRAVHPLAVDRQKAIYEYADTCTGVAAVLMGNAGIGTAWLERMRQKDLDSQGGRNG